MLLTFACAACGRGERRPASEAAPPSPPPQADAVAGDERASPPAAAPAAELTPEFRLTLDPGSHVVRAELDIALAAADTINLLFRADWEGYPGLESRIGSLDAFSGRTGSLPVAASGGEPGRYRVAAPGGAGLTLSYTLRLTPPSEVRFYHRASQLGPAGGHLIGRDLLPLVWLSSRRIRPSQRARIWFAGLPPDWRIATVAARARNGYEVGDVRDAVFAVGPLETRTFNVGPRAVTVAILGDWRVSDDRIFEALEAIAGSLHGIAGDGWRDGPHLILAGRVPSAPDKLATGGQVIDRSGLVYVGGDWPGTQAFERWLPTAAHELMHWYIPTGFDFSEAPPSWFAEGFDDYMALKALLAGGLMTPEGFLVEMGERIARYRSSALYGKVSADEAGSDFWEEKSYRYIYDGGAAVAFLLDLGFQDRRLSLEHALRELRGDGAVDEGRIVQELVAVRENEWLPDWVATGANPDWDSRLRRYRLTWRGDILSATEPWATDALSGIRP